MIEINKFPDNDNNQLTLLAMVSNIVAAYVSNHTINIDDLPHFIQLVRKSLCNSHPKTSLPPPSPAPPHVPIENSLTPNYIICLEDGKPMKTLKRHLKNAHGITPDVYRKRWGLPANYPMVAPHYTKQRQRIAKKIKLGKKQRQMA